ncbi:MAG: SMC-Scp complex subunit ScpB [Minisyncoccia bacterium]
MDLNSILESILFASNEPQTSEDLSKILNIPIEEIENSLLNLQKYYLENNRGLRLLNNNNKWLLSINPENTSYLNKFKKEVLEGDLSSAVLETLAIIAYRGPISRAEINEIRGVDSSYILHQLLLRELIERFPNPQRTNIFLYQVSFKFLKHLGLNSIKDLPNYEELHQKISNI